MYIFNIKPIPKPRMVRSDTWANRRCVSRYWVFKDELKLLARSLDYEIGKVIDLVFLIPMPDSWSVKKKQQMRGQSHEQTPDTDNLIKAFKDCLADRDEAVWCESARKYWWDSGAIIVLKNENSIGNFSEVMAIYSDLLVSFPLSI